MTTFGYTMHDGIAHINEDTIDDPQETINGILAVEASAKSKRLCAVEMLIDGYDPGAGDVVAFLLNEREAEVVWREPTHPERFALFYWELWKA